jgi:hypothetical protein
MASKYAIKNVKKDKRIFSSTAKKTDPRNRPKVNPRGGFRL